MFTAYIQHGYMFMYKDATKYFFNVSDRTCIHVHVQCTCISVYGTCIHVYSFCIQTQMTMYTSKCSSVFFFILEKNGSLKIAIFNYM